MARLTTACCERERGQRRQDNRDAAIIDEFAAKPDRVHHASNLDRGVSPLMPISGLPPGTRGRSRSPPPPTGPRYRIRSRGKPRNGAIRSTTRVGGTGAIDPAFAAQARRLRSSRPRPPPAAFPIPVLKEPYPARNAGSPARFTNLCRPYVELHIRPTCGRRDTAAHDCSNIHNRHGTSGTPPRLLTYDPVTMASHNDQVVLDGPATANQCHFPRSVIDTRTSRTAPRIHRSSR